MFNRPVYMREWRKNNMERIRLYDTAYYAAHKSEGRQQANKWRRGNHEYTIWLKMLWRCRNPRAKDYPRYGGRGIQVRYETFYEFLSDVGIHADGLSIDRINNNGHYEIGNCRWATAKQQRANRRDSKKVLTDTASGGIIVRGTL